MPALFRAGYNDPHRVGIDRYEKYATDKWHLVCRACNTHTALTSESSRGRSRSILVDIYRALVSHPPHLSSNELARMSSLMDDARDNEDKSASRYEGITRRCYIR